MATAYTMDNAEWTFSDDLVALRNDQGGFVQNRVENPWALVRFADEVNRFVVPTNGAAWIGSNGLPVAKLMPNEVMPFLPFPLESARPARTSDPRDPVNAGGPVAVHYFTWY